MKEPLPGVADLLFADWIIQRRRQCLARDSEEIALDPKEWGVLLQLAEAAPALVPTRDLLMRIWPEAVVGDNVVHRVIARLRKVLGDDARRPVYIETLPKRGYRLMVPVIASTEGSRCKQYRIALQPFVYWGPGAGGLARGVMDAVEAGLSRFPGILVTRYLPLDQPEASPAMQPLIGDGTTYLLRGSVRALGEQLRVTVQLLRENSQEVLWSHSLDRVRLPSQGFDFALEDHLQATISAAVADSFGVIRTSELKELLCSAAARSTGYHAVLLAQGAVGEGCPRHRVDAAIAALEAALKREPDYADGWAWLGAMYRDRFPADLRASVRRERDEMWRKAEQAARRALSIDRTNQEALIVLFGAYQHRSELPSFIGVAERALALNPNSADLHLAVAGYMAISGLDEAEDHAKVALSLSQPDPIALMFFPLFVHGLRVGDYDRALACVRSGLARADASLITYTLLMGGLAVCGQLGNFGEADQYLRRLRSDYDWEDCHIRSFFEYNNYYPAVVRPWNAGLRKALGMIPGSAS